MFGVILGPFGLKLQKLAILVFSGIFIFSEPEICVMTALEGHFCADSSTWMSKRLLGAMRTLRTYN